MGLVLYVVFWWFVFWVWWFRFVVFCFVCFVVVFDVLIPRVSWVVCGSVGCVFWVLAANNLMLVSACLGYRFVDYVAWVRACGFVILIWIFVWLEGDFLWYLLVMIWLMIFVDLVGFRFVLLGLGGLHYGVWLFGFGFWWFVCFAILVVILMLVASRIWVCFSCLVIFLFRLILRFLMSLVLL